MKIWREPLVQFLLLGAALFGVFAWAGKPAGAERPEQIVLTPGLLENLRVSFERMEQHPPSAKEMDAAVAGYVREEILNREARALGLDRDDVIVRRRLAQRMEFQAEAGL